MARQDEPDIRLKVGFLRHPKTMRVRKELGADGVLCLLNILMFARANCHKDGALKGLSDDDIEAVAEWHLCESHAPGMLVACLSHAGFLDGENGARRIHEWNEHQAFAANFHKRSKAGKNAASARWSKTSDQSEPHAKRMRTACAAHTERNAPSPTPTPMGRREEEPKQPPSPTGSAVLSVGPTQKQITEAVALREYENRVLARKGLPLLPNLTPIPPVDAKRNGSPS